MALRRMKAVIRFQWMMFLRQRMLLEKRAQGTVRAWWVSGSQGVREAEWLFWDPKDELLEPWPGIGGQD